MGREPRRRALAAAGRLVGALHRAGLQHPDLNLKNLLVQTDRQARHRAYIIDLEKCRLLDHLPQRKRARMLTRLRRSIRRFEQQTGQRLQDPEWEAFMSAYGEGNAPGPGA